MWYLLLASIVLTALALYGLNRIAFRNSDESESTFDQFSAAIQYVIAAVVESGNSSPTSSIVPLNLDILCFFFFFAYQIHAGFSCRDARLAIRLVASSWALLSFVVVMSYSSTLISYVSSPNRNPIIESVEDIPKVPGLQIVVDKGYTIEYVILVGCNISVSIRWQDFNCSKWSITFSSRKRFTYFNRN